MDIHLRREINKCLTTLPSDVPENSVAISPDESEIDAPDVSLLGQKRQQKQRAQKRKRVSLAVAFREMFRYSWIQRGMTHPCMPGSILTVTWDLLLVFVTIAIAWIYTYQVQTCTWGFVHCR